MAVLASAQLRNRRATTISPLAMTSIHDRILFASDAELMTYWGIAMLVLAGACSLMERRRLKRAQINRVGWMPWTGLFLTFAVLGGGLLAVAVPALFKPA